MNNKNEGEWEKIVTSFLGDEGVESLGLSQFLPRHETQQERMEQNVLRESAPAEKAPSWSQIGCFLFFVALVILLVGVWWST